MIFDKKLEGDAWTQLSYLGTEERDIVDYVELLLKSSLESSIKQLGQQIKTKRWGDTVIGR